jgi:hypothetical protein
MTTQNLTTARFVLQSLLQELEAFDRCIPVAQNIRVGDVADALTVFMADRRILRLTMPDASPASRRRRRAQAVRPSASKRKTRVSCLA